MSHLNATPFSRWLLPNVNLLVLIFQSCNYSSSSSFLACNSRLRCAVRRPHPPQRPVLGHIHCFRQCEIVGSQILLYGAQPCDAGRPHRHLVITRCPWVTVHCVFSHICGLLQEWRGMAQCRQKRTGGRGLIFTVFLRKLFMDDPITRMALRTGHTSANVSHPAEFLPLNKCRVMCPWKIKPETKCACILAYFCRVFNRLFHVD